MRILTKKTLKVLEEIILKTGINFNFVDLGGGFGIKYKSSEKKIKLKKYSQSVEKFKKKFLSQEGLLKNLKKVQL